MREEGWSLRCGATRAVGERREIERERKYCTL